MQPETWRKLESIFFAALDLAPEDRGLYLDEACAGDPEFRAEIEAVLAAHAVDEERGDGPGVWELGVRLRERGALVGARIGHYQLEALIGRGGMGMVYQARDTRGRTSDPVAIKLLGASRYSEKTRKRFEREQRILAALKHPNIARLLDAGLIDEGIPYLVMEFVSGLPIDAHCAQRDLAVDARLRLLCDVAQAVHYAHESNVVHRDLKPSNILVPAHGTAKLLDFGIAKIIASADEQLSVSLTESGVLLLTPSYAAPEQVAGSPITPATDVYALGVVLYELLTGRLPLDLRGRPPGEIVDAILREEPSAPSSVNFPESWRLPRAAAAMAESDQSVERYRRYLAEKLDGIVMTALAKEPGRRQASAKQLAEEIEARL